jgi:hypothetical protein
MKCDNFYPGEHDAAKAHVRHIADHTAAPHEKLPKCSSEQTPSNILGLAGAVAERKHARRATAGLDCNKLVECHLDVANEAGGAVEIPHFQAERLLQVVVGRVFTLDLHGRPGGDNGAPQHRQLADGLDGPVG